MSPSPAIAALPRLRLEEYFVGSTRGWGIFRDRLGRLRRQFVVDIDGTWDGRVLTLDERFAYDDGETGRRVWRFRATGNDRYQATADDVVGVVEGRADGSTLNLRYRIALPIRGRSWLLAFDDWFFLQGGGVLLNRATVSKFGLAVGEVTIAFRRLQPASAEEPAVA